MIILFLFESSIVTGRSRYSLSFSHSGSATETASWFNENYPMNDMGRMAERNHRRKLIVGKSYKITYRDRSTVKTERIVDIRERKGKYITAYCHLRKAARTFKRSRIKGIEPV